ncbi:hypothetical protein LINPERHAP1_LOCUS26154 [Linum perenne]
MAEDRSEAAISWLWTIEYLATLEDFDSSLLDELIELAPDDVRKTAQEMLQSPLPTKCSLVLEQTKEQLVGGFISDDLLKEKSGIFTEQVNSHGSKVSESVKSVGNGVMKENNGESILTEIAGEQLNRQPTSAEVDDHPIKIGGGDLNVQNTESVKGDGVLLETLDSNAGVVDNNPQPSTGEKELTVETGGGDLNVPGTESIEEKEEDDDVAVPMEIPDANADDGVLDNNPQPSTGEKELTVETGGGDLNVQGTDSIEEKEEDDVAVPMEIPDAIADDGVVDNNPQPSTGEKELTVETGGGDLNVQVTESIDDEEEEEDDDVAVPMEIPDANADDGVQSNNAQPSTSEKGLTVETGGGDLNVQGTESTDEEEEEEDGDVAIDMEIPDPNANNGVQSNNEQPSTGETQHEGETGGGDLNVQGNESVPDSDDDTVILDTPVRLGNCELDNNHRQPSTPGTEPIVETSGTNHDGQEILERNKSVGVDHDDSVREETSKALADNGVPNCQQPSNAKIDHPHENGGHTNKEHVKPGGNQPSQSNHNGSSSVKTHDAHADQNHQPPTNTETEHHPLRASNANGEERVSRKGKMNNFVEAQQPSNAKIYHPHENGGHTNKEHVISGVNQPSQSNHNGSSSVKTPDAHADQNHQPPTNTETEHHPLRASNANGEEQVSRKRKMNSFVEAQQPSLPVDTSNFTELNMCGRCHRPGALLVCGSVNCPMMLHRDCLGYDANYEDGRDFYCPLCAHSRAVAQLHEAKRRVASTQRNLTVFVDLSMRSLND